MALVLCAALACTSIALGPFTDGAAIAASKSDTKASASKSKYAFRQFTGYVTALDKDKLTVEKRGKQPQSKVFSKHAEMKTTGELEKDARVTVYYRDEGGQAVAHKVVVKDANGSKSRG
jgi:hypothetical protein